jgi:site-specific DNA-methyltransferase (adenine-specific)
MTLGNGKKKIFRGSDDWDSKAPSAQYFDELERVSTNQIIWGVNHFAETFHKNSPCWIFWDKGTGANDFADGEYAYTSFQSHARKCFISWVGANARDKDGARIHPTQKPVALYKWLLTNYAKPGDKILDTHVGSASSLIACYELGFDYMGFELDKDYWEAATKRLEAVKAQTRLDLAKAAKPEQTTLLAD